MSERVFFTETAIKATEKAVRKYFNEGANMPDEVNRVKARIGRDIGPLFMRKVLEEVNRGTSAGVVREALCDVMAWTIATSIAAERDDEKRFEALTELMTTIATCAAGYNAFGKMQTAEGGEGEIIQGGVQ